MIHTCQYVKVSRIVGKEAALVRGKAERIVAQLIRHEIIELEKEEEEEEENAMQKKERDGNDEEEKKTRSTCVPRGCVCIRIRIRRPIMLA